ncbi:MAG: UvrB/UvrC motif-containing protein [Actinomycetota bacterium]|nr:UvrB/UvrC motif-containing protein [Actinomycetota bacterium]
MIERAREHALRARVEAARADEQATQRIRELRRAKQQAIESQEFERAAGLRDQERKIMEQSSARTELQPEVLLQEISRRLGIPRTDNPPSSEPS